MLSPIPVERDPRREGSLCRGSEVGTPDRRSPAVVKNRLFAVEVNLPSVRVLTPCPSGGAGEAPGSLLRESQGFERMQRAWGVRTLSSAAAVGRPDPGLPPGQI